MKIPRVPVTILKNGKTLSDTAMAIPEERISIHLNGNETIQITCRPENPEEPAVGMLHNHGVFHAREKIKNIRVYPGEGVVSIQARTNGKALEKMLCSLSESAGKPFPPFKDPRGRRSGDIETKSNTDTMNEDFLGALSSMTSRFKESIDVKSVFGAYRVAAIGNDKGRLLHKAGDLDMETAVDRIIGRAFLAGTGLRGLTLLISGRVRPETVYKASRHGIRTIVSSTVVTSLVLMSDQASSVDLVHYREEDGMLTIYRKQPDANIGDSYRATAENDIYEAGTGA